MPATRRNARSASKDGAAELAAPATASTATPAIDTGRAPYLRARTPAGTCSRPAPTRNTATRRPNCAAPTENVLPISGSAGPVSNQLYAYPILSAIRIHVARRTVRASNGSGPESKFALLTTAPSAASGAVHPAPKQIRGNRLRTEGPRPPVMDIAEYDLSFFHREGFHRRACAVCGAAFWSLGDHDRCQEAPCRDYGFLGHPGFNRPYELRAMREKYLTYFEARGHTRLRRYPTVARWRNDVFFTQASIYDFQPWVTSGAILPPANPLTISQPVLRFIDLAEVGHSGRHLTLFEMMAHHAFNRPDHEVYWKDRTVELCHELLVGDLGADPRGITYKEEVWEGGGNLGPSLSVGLLGLELGTLVFMEYIRNGDAVRPMPLTVVDTGYGLERFTWMSQGTKTAYEAVFGREYDELRRTFPPAEAAILIDHARALNFLLTDGVVPSNSKEGYFARLLLRRSDPDPRAGSRGSRPPPVARPDRARDRPRLPRGRCPPGRPPSRGDRRGRTVPRVDRSGPRDHPALRRARSVDRGQGHRGRPDPTVRLPRDPSRPCGGGARAPSVHSGRFLCASRDPSRERSGVERLRREGGGTARRPVGNSAD